MKITHLCLGCFYIDDFSYQENMLPKFHKKMGLDVEIIASTISFDSTGTEIVLDQSGTYENEYGIKVTRLPFKENFNKKINKKLKNVEGLEEVLDNSDTDILFIHGSQFLGTNIVKKYLRKNSKVICYVDNHADFSNSATNWFSKLFLHKMLWKYKTKQILPYVRKFYGVLPARVDFLTDVYRIPKEKVELLVMGADDDQINNLKIINNEDSINHNQTITVVTGGKIDNFKKQILTLMEIFNELENSKFKLIVFGSVTENLQDEVIKLSQSENVDYIGWVTNEESYQVIDSADLVVFPGRHSVYWEQTVGQGKPLLVKYWPGTTHIDTGGNVEFLMNDSKEELKNKLFGILNDNEKLSLISNNAKIGKSDFLYSTISRKSIEL